MSNTKLELPSMMSPKQAMKMLQWRLDTTAVKMRRMACVNAKIVVTPASVNAETREVNPGDLQYDKAYCQNDRRNGSKFCQACSDAHNNGKA